MVVLLVVQVVVLVVVQMMEECWLLVQVVVVWKGHEPEAETRWEIGGQKVLSWRRWCSKVEMKVLKRVVKWVH